MSQLATITPRTSNRARTAAAGPSPLDLVRMRLPRELATGFRPHTGPLAKAVIAAVAREVPEYTAPMAGPLGHIVSATMQAVFLRSIDAVVSPRGPREDWTELSRSIGSAEFTAGRSLSGLQAALHAAEQAVTQHVSVYLRRSGLSLDAAQLCARAISAAFSYVSATSTEGYAEAKARGPRSCDRSRQDLFRLLTAEHPVDDTTRAAAARSAGWPVPSAVTAVMLRPPAGQELPAPEVLGLDLLAGVDNGEPMLIAAAGEPALDKLVEILPGWRAAIGPAVPVSDLRASLRVARRAMDLADRGLLPDQPLVDCSDHHTVLTLFADDWLVDRLIERRLAPLAELTDRQQERMLVTLHEWLITRGQVTEIGERLNVHPQTVRYRLKKLEEIFGAELTDPETRFELALAVRAKLQGSVEEEAEVAPAC
jgi:hypothetical protein